MTHPDQNPNGGALAVISSGMGELKHQLTTILAKQEAQQELLTRLDERQHGWATKMEVAEMVSTFREQLAPVAAQSVAAHTRLDNLTGSLAVLGGKVDKVDDRVAQVEEHLIRMDTADKVQSATVTGGWWVGSRIFGYVAGIVSIVAAYVIGRYIG